MRSALTIPRHAQARSTTWRRAVFWWRWPAVAIVLFAAARAGKVRLVAAALPRKATATTLPAPGVTRADVDGRPRRCCAGTRPARWDC